jgi:hypothetical protein
MHDTSARLVERVLPAASYRHWVLTVPFPLRLRIARDPGHFHAIVAEALFAKDGDAVQQIDLPQPSDEDVRCVLAQLVRKLHRAQTPGVEEPVKKALAQTCRRQ